MRPDSVAECNSSPCEEEEEGKDVDSRTRLFGSRSQEAVSPKPKKERISRILPMLSYPKDCGGNDVSTLALVDKKRRLQVLPETKPVSSNRGRFLLRPFSKRTDISPLATIPFSAQQKSTLEKEGSPSTSYLKLLKNIDGSKQEDARKLPSSFPPPKLAKAGSSTISWAVPQIPLLKRGESFPAPLLSNRYVEPKPDSNEYTVHHLFSILQDPACAIDSQVFITAWNRLRHLISTELLNKSNRENVVSLLSSLLNNERYHRDRNLALQIVLSIHKVIPLASNHDDHDCFATLLKPVIDLAKSHCKEDSGSESNQKKLQVLCVAIVLAILASSWDASNQNYETFLVEYLAEQVKEGIQMALIPLAQIASKFSSETHLLQNLFPLSEYLWPQLLEYERLPVAVIEASIVLLSFVTLGKGPQRGHEGRKLREKQILSILSTLSHLQESSLTTPLALTLLVDCEWEHDHSTFSTTNNAHTVATSNFQHLNRLTRRYKEEPTVQVPVLIVTRKLVQMIQGMLTTGHYFTVFKMIEAAIADLATDDEVLTICCHLVSDLVHEDTALDVMMNCHTDTFNKILQNVPRLLGKCDSTFASDTMNLLLRVSSKSKAVARSNLLRTSIELLDRVDSNLKPSVIRMIRNCLESIIPSTSLDEQDNEGYEENGLVGHLVQVMQEQNSLGEELVQDCCSIFATLYSHKANLDDREGMEIVSLRCGQSMLRMRLFAEAELEALLGAVSAHAKNEQIQQTCTFALSRYFQVLAVALPSSESNACHRIYHPTVVKGGIQLVLRGLSADNCHVLVVHIQLLCALIPFVRKFAPNSDIVETLVARATQHLRVNSIQISTLAALHFFSQVEGIEHVLKSDESIPFLLCCIRQGSNVTSLEASTIVHEMIKHDPYAVGERFLSIPKGPQLLIDCMRRHSTTVLVLDCLCCAFEALTLVTNIDELQRYRLWNDCNENGGAGYLITLMTVLNCFSDNKSIVRSACRAMIGLFPVVDEDVLWRQKKQLCSITAQVLKEISGVEMAEEAIVDAWLHLCQGSDGFRGELFPHIPLLLECMQNHQNSTRLHTKICEILDLIAQFEGPTLLMIYPECIDCVLQSVAIHCAAPRHVKKVLKTLTVLVASDDSGRIEETKFNEIFSFIIQTHSSSPSIIAQTFNVLNNLTVIRCTTVKKEEPSYKSSSIIQDDMLRFVVWSMTEYAHVQKIQANACRLLRSLLILEDQKNQQQQQQRRNLPSTIRYHKDPLFPLLLAAAEKFPHSCAHRAQDVLSRL